MLKRLYINNFALIREMDVNFPGKLSVITGETGAGKSIFLEALGMALGKRAEPSTLKNKDQKCIIEAEFDTGKIDLKSFFEENDLEQESHLVLRREISADGKSRSFLNDSLVGLNTLKQLSEKLVDIHSQHQTLLLNQANFQMELVDAFAGNFASYKTFKTTYKQLNDLTNTLQTLEAQEAQGRKELDYHQFLHNELEETELKPGLLQVMEDEARVLENAETIKSQLQAVSNQIAGEHSLLDQLAQIKQSLQGLTRYGAVYKELFVRINSTYIELKDLSADIENAEADVHFDNTRLETLNTNLDKLNRLLKKHGVHDETALLAIKTDIDQKLSRFGSLETEIEHTKKRIATVKAECHQLATTLSKARLGAIPAIEKEVKQMLAELSMENAIFKIELTREEDLNAYGFDKVKFLFSANKGQPLCELQKVASGGEMSRLMLSLKALLASRKAMPTIIFDEIDTGVSGEVADKIGNILLKMGSSMQVLAITHLPQMASKGQHHLFVYKKDSEDKTISYIRELSKEERVTEIAKMLSTGNPTQSALKNAKELLSLN